MKKSDEFDLFPMRHIGPSQKDVEEMLEAVGASSLEDLIDQTVPASIRLREPMDSIEPMTESETLGEARRLASKNRVFRSFIGQGYSDCVTPPVIQRNILENPGWYTQYTPYQAEIAQGRLEALLNFQTVIADLTGMEVANASLLDEGTAAAEAMGLCFNVKGKKGRNRFFISEDCHPQTIDVVRTRARPLGINVVVGESGEFDTSCFGALLQYPTTDGSIRDYEAFCRSVHEADAVVVVAADLLSLMLLKPPGEWGADIVVGNSQRFGVPMGFGGPHAAFFATSEKHRRRIPGRLVGVSRDSEGKPALRLALQTREQHIRRDKATSNICTAQVLLAVMSGMYAVYHGPDGLRKIANRVHRYTAVLARVLSARGFPSRHEAYFDTLRVDLDEAAKENALSRAEAAEMNFRVFEDGIGIALDQKTRLSDLADIVAAVSGAPIDLSEVEALDSSRPVSLPRQLRRTTEVLTHPVFHTYRSETEMMRYIHRLQSRDLSLTTSMIPLGSCTMKLNGTAEMYPITWPEFGGLHPFAPSEQAEGYKELIADLENMLSDLTGFSAVSLQPNAGSQGEFAGLLTIRAYHEGRGEGNRDICLIPESAHGTNPASAVMAGLKVVAVACDSQGDIDLDDLRMKSEKYADRLAALMVTYPSTHGVFEEAIRDIAQVIHDFGGQVYMDGANLNALLGICKPAEFGADVCHLNLHKTFCIPHGGGGPGIGPIAVGRHLEPFLPGHFQVPLGTDETVGPVAAAPWGSASILPISWAYMKLMGTEGLTRATQIAILNANYIAQRVDAHFPVLYRGQNGRVAHECILDLRHFKRAIGIDVNDVAKRLMDYGFHAPTVAWPVVETVMVEPTESESKAELDRFCEAMMAIRQEIAEVEEGRIGATESPLRNAPHTALNIADDGWDRPYSRMSAAFPLPWVRDHKFWPPVGRIDNAYGDRNLFCSCVPMDELEPVEV